MENRELISEIKDKLKFATTIAIFFAGAMHYFFSIYDPTRSNQVALQYSFAVVAYLLSYIFFELVKNDADPVFLSYSNHLLLLGFVIFLMPLGYIVTLKNELTAFETLFFKISIWGVLLFPIFIFASIFFCWLWVSVKKFRKKPKKNH